LRDALETDYEIVVPEKLDAKNTLASSRVMETIHTNLPPAVLREIIESQRHELCLGPRHDWSVRVGDTFWFVETRGPRTVVLVGGKVASMPVSAFTFVGILTLAVLLVTTVGFFGRRR
jgi:hypothetical protein